MIMKYRILPILADLVPAAISACEGVLFDTLASCPRCGGDISDYDIRTKQFAVINDDHATKTITVKVKRFRCRVCHAVVYAHQPFYPDTRAGSPLVDLCITFASIMPYARASAYLQRIGIVVDRWSVRNYATKNIAVATTGVYGTILPVSIIALADLAAQAGTDKHLDSTDVLSACGYPSLKRSDGSGN